MRKLPEDRVYGFVSVYKIKLDRNLKLHHFPDANRDWIHFVAANRKHGLFLDELREFNELDIIGGKIANDRTAQTLLLYIGGAYGRPGTELADNIAIQTLMPNRLKDQFCFRTENAISLLEFIRSEQYEVRK